MEPKVGIILINYKDYAKRFLSDCRDGLELLDYPKDKYIVYIVDNATSEETQNYLRDEYPEAVVLPNAGNAGWAGGNNVGIARAMADGCEDVVFLNVDVIVEREWLRELVLAAYSDEKIGIVQSKILLHPVNPVRERMSCECLDDGIKSSSKLFFNRQQDRVSFSNGVKDIPRINSLGNDIHFLMFGFCRGYGEPDSDADLSVKDIPYASGSSMYVKGEVVKKIGMCDENFFMYHDDFDFCLRAKLMGFRLVVAPKSRMRHKYEFNRSVRQVYFMERNRLICLLYFYKWPTLALIFPALLAYEFGILFFSIKNGYAMAKLASWGFFFSRKNLKKILSKRRKIQSSRQISDREMSANFVGIIGFQEINNHLNKYFANPVFNLYWKITRKIIRW
ncbi:MAG: glycosyltransferase family 2 protein [Patescibacteria group bacterium]